MTGKTKARRTPLDVAEYCLTWTGFETDLIFSHGAELPGFAAYPLLKNAQGRGLLQQGYQKVMAQATRVGAVAILESATWVANPDRGKAIGYGLEDLAEANRSALRLMAQTRNTAGGPEVLLSANIGPREDAYAPQNRMSVAEAQDYHEMQLRWLADTEADFVTAYTMSYPAEAAGMVRAAQATELPIVVAFTVETDGRLPTGIALDEAIAKVDATTDGHASYFMVNCAHPSHIATALTAPLCRQRVCGLVANASRCSHTELDAASTLDQGNPTEFGIELADLARAHPQVRVLGGCCGTDMRHLAATFASLGADHQQK